MGVPSFLSGQSGKRAAGDPFLRARDERVESLKAVVGKLAHDFNNFLVPQFGYITLLKEELGANETAVQYLSTMETAGRTTEAYIESVLLAMRPQRQYSPKQLDLQALLEQALQRWQSELPPSLELRVQPSTVQVSFHGDERHWTKVFEHLLSNARFALASGGTLGIDLGFETLSSSQADRLGIDASEVIVLRFRDNGFGMPQENLSRVFEPFFTTHALTRGSGLGLTIVHTVAHFYGGQVELESREGEGAVVTLWVPRTAPGTARASTAKAGALPQRPARKKKVLVVESDPVLREVLRITVADLGLDVQAAEKTADGVKFLKRDPGACALVIIDANLLVDPANEIGAAIPNETPVILICSKSAPAPTVAGRATLHLVQKPLSLPKLRALVRECTEPAKPASQV